MERSMKEQAKRSVAEGALYGVLAGILFGLVEIGAAALMGAPASGPLRMFASIVLGRDALGAGSLGTVAIVGSIVHLALSAIFGIVYRAFLAWLAPGRRLAWGKQGGVGLLYGGALWLVNFQIVARLLYPWFLDTPQLQQFLLHALFFGLPLSWMYAGAERQVFGPGVRPSHA
jgi:hypothetical protein